MKTAEPYRTPTQICQQVHPNGIDVCTREPNHKHAHIGFTDALTQVIWELVELCSEQSVAENDLYILDGIWRKFPAQNKRAGEFKHPIFKLKTITFTVRFL